MVDLEDAFDRLWRADRFHSCHQKGSGLGLAITKAIVHNRQGTINTYQPIECR